MADLSTPAPAAPSTHSMRHAAPSSRRPVLQGLRSPFRFLVAGFCLIGAASHLPVIEDHLDEAPYIGVLFILLSLAYLAASALLAWGRDSRALYLALAVMSVVAVAAYAWSRSFGLPEMADDIGRWTEPLGVVAITSEALAALTSAVALRSAFHRNTESTEGIERRLPVRRQLLLGLVVTSLGLAWTGVAAAGTHSSSMSMAGMKDMNGMNGMTSNSYWNAVGGGSFHSDGITRTYYISADEVAWNYAPQGKNMITGKLFDDVADTYVQRGPGRVGSTYLKCLYRGYTDASFRTPQVRSTADQYLGLLGPVIHAAVGDTIKVVFRNTCPFPTSVHPHGVFYNKDSEGAPYNDGTTATDKTDDGVPTGNQHVYTWLVPDRAGPGPNDGSSVMWMYHSHTDEIGDTYAGLMGPMVVTRAGMARSDGSPKDVDREVFALFAVMNENNSPLLTASEHRYEQPYRDTADDEEFEESNLMHSVNGYVFGNQPMITIAKGQRVRWYVMSMGTEVDLHTPHWHGNDVTVNGMRMDVVSLLPAGMIVADMVPDNPGTWLFHCHVNDHITAGMLTRYRVTG
jgi:FtsP/CotA-like multicopper oxidase with cupredoxin domain